MTPRRSDQAFVRMPDAEFEAILTRAAEEGAKRALADVVLDGDDPPARQHFKAFCGIGALDDLDGPSAEGFQRIPRFGPCRPAVHCPAGDCAAICREGANTCRNDG